MIPKTQWQRLLALVVAVLAGSTGLRADVKLPALFSDNTVLQQGVSVPVWGWADEGEKVTVKFLGQTVSTTAKDGKWMVRLSSLKAGGPHMMLVSGKNGIVIRNVLVGEVWVCSGQSNMEWPMRLSHDSKADIAGSENSRIRLFTVPKLKAEVPVKDVKASWVECGPMAVTNFSAVAYYFGRALQNAKGVPVGLIHTSWGGSPAEVWMSQDALARNEEYQRAIVEAYNDEARRTPDKKPFWRPTELYNGMIAPLLPYAIKGAIWYQGESNAGRAWQYRSLFTDMIRNWRRDWKQGDFTFLEVQLAPFDKGRKRPLTSIIAATGNSDWAELRDAQVYATKALPNVGMAVITDVGDKDDIHPSKKAPVGERLALAARRVAYGERIVHAGPTYNSIFVDGDKIKVSFDNVGAGLEARDGKLTGFSIAGDDGRFFWANAEIEGKRVVVSSPLVPNPAAVRYGWADYPVVNLWNKNGLPASPFRTDKFPLTTQPK